jgi:YidC/Oxa1 family membrane protein insertase
VLRHLSNSGNAANAYLSGRTLSANYTRQLTLYSFSKSEAASAAKARLFGAPLAASFRDGTAQIVKLGGTDAWSTRWVILPLLLISAGATFATQLLARANATVAPTGTNATLQKLFLYVFPLGVLASGLIFNFPLGVLLYWFTSNTWTLAQQAYIIRFHPPAAVESTVTTAATAKSVAPRPGQKPERARPSKPAAGVNGAAAAPKAAAKTMPETATPDSAGQENGATSAGSDVVPPGVPRPQRTGQRTNRPGSRPAAKRPSQAKKRR